MRGFTTTIVVGTMVKDVVLHKTKTDKSVASFTLAVNHDKDEVSFIDIVAWNKPAEIIAEHVKKGTPLLVRGELKQRTWTQDGANRSKVEVVLDTFMFMPTGRVDAQDGHQTVSQDVVVDDIPDGPIDLSQIPF